MSASPGLKTPNPALLHEAGVSPASSMAAPDLSAQSRLGPRYGLLGLALAFLALPLHVHLPGHYAAMGLPIGALGLLLLALRTTDAVADPWLGTLADRWLDACAGNSSSANVRGLRGRLAGLALVLGLSFQALLAPPMMVRSSGAPALLLWCGVCLLACYLSFSLLSILHQSWAARLPGGDASQARWAAWREGFGLAGVVLASVLPALMGIDSLGAVLAAALAAGCWGLCGLPVLRPAAEFADANSSSHAPFPAEANAQRRKPRQPYKAWMPWRSAGFRRLMLVQALSGTAAAVPATLVLFFIRDRLMAPAWEPVLLSIYFLAAACALPVWVRAVRGWGLVRCWAGGMGLAVAAFVGTLALGPGDAAWFALICAASGMALGADLAVPPALLVAQMRQSQADRPGLWFGWWTVLAKLNLALAAGLALPLLQGLGYSPGAASNSDQTLLALSLVYAALPCGLKLIALALLWRWRLRLEPSAQTP